MREITYAQAINEGTDQAMKLCDEVFVMGQLVDTLSGIFGTTTGLVDKYGKERVIDMPVAESLMTSAAIGAAAVGMRPVLAHQRLDFMLYSMDAIVNWIALWRFKSGGKCNLPLTIRAVVGRGWGQGPQHSKSLHAWFGHLPGLQVAIPSTAYDIKGLMMESILGENPTFFIEHRGLFSQKDQVPEEPYRVPFGKGVVRRSGKDITVVAIGNFVPFALRCAAELYKDGIEVEVIDPRTLSPLDVPLILESVKKTGRLVVADPGWASYGAASEIITQVCMELATELKAKPARVTLPDSHTPMSRTLEDLYYPSEEEMIATLKAQVNG